jgi:hypothetical protein
LCPSTREEKRRLFDSHNPNSLMVAELNGRYHRSHPLGIREGFESKSTVLPPMGLKLSFILAKY